MENLEKEFKKSYDSLYYLCLRRVSDPLIAEDLVQETFLAAQKSVENPKANFKGNSSIKTWLFGILKNKIRDHYRKKSNDKRIHFSIDSLDFAQELTSLEGFLKEEISESLVESKDAFESLYLKEIFDYLENSLTKNVKETFSLYLEGYSAKEISKKQGISENNVWARNHRARNELAYLRE